MNPPSITVVHSIHQYVLLDKGLTKVLLIKASSTWAQNFDILTEFSLNEAHKLFDTINMFSGKHSPMHPTSIHLIKQYRKPLINNSALIQSYTFKRSQGRKVSTLVVSREEGGAADLFTQQANGRALACQRHTHACVAARPRGSGDEGRAGGRGKGAAALARACDAAQFWGTSRFG